MSSSAQLLLCLHRWWGTLRIKSTKWNSYTTFPSFLPGYAKLCQWSPTITNVCIAHDPLVLTQPNMDTSNFGFDAVGRPVVLDSGEIGWPPKSLDLYTLFRTTAFTQTVAVHLFSPDEATRLRAQRNLASMTGMVLG